MTPHELLRGRPYTEAELESYERKEYGEVLEKRVRRYMLGEHLRRIQQNPVGKVKGAAQKSGKLRQPELKDFGMKGRGDWVTKGTAKKEPTTTTKKPLSGKKGLMKKPHHR